MHRVLTFAQQIEQSFLTDRRKEIWRPFMRAIRDYELIQPGDRIAVCISGGKDSMLLAKLMQMLARHSEVPFEAVYLIMDPGYSTSNRLQIESNTRKLEIPYILFESDVFEVAETQEEHSCFLCARMRRGCLYGKAAELGCNKIALGHHFNDVIETTVMAMFYGGQLQAMPPKLHAKNFPGMELIRPLYMIHEDAIIDWKDSFGLDFIQCACRFTQNGTREAYVSRRRFVKALLSDLNEDHPKVEQNVFNSIHQVQLNTMIRWKYRGKEHSFLDDYSDAPET